jgi:TonB family protein
VRTFLLLLVVAATPFEASARSRERIPVFEAGRSDYPADWNSSQRGLVLLRFRLLADSRIGDCLILRSTVSRALAATSCRLVTERARFAPERDDAGQVRASWHNAYFNWRGPGGEFGGALSVNEVTWFRSSDYPRDGYDRRVEGRVTMTYDITATGRLENCQVVRSSGFTDLDQAACHAYTERGSFLPARNSSGEPIRTRGQTNWRFHIAH